MKGKGGRDHQKGRYPGKREYGMGKGGRNDGDGGELARSTPPLSLLPGDEEKTTLRSDVLCGVVS